MILELFVLNVLTAYDVHQDVAFHFVSVSVACYSLNQSAVDQNLEGTWHGGNFLVDHRLIHGNFIAGFVLLARDNNIFLNI